MELFEFLMILASVVIGLGITEILTAFISFFAVLTLIAPSSSC